MLSHWNWGPLHRKKFTAIVWLNWCYSHQIAFWITIYVQWLLLLSALPREFATPKLKVIATEAYTWSKWWVEVIAEYSIINEPSDSPLLSFRKHCESRMLGDCKNPKEEWSVWSIVVCVWYNHCTHELTKAVTSWTYNTCTRLGLPCISWLRQGLVRVTDFWLSRELKISGEGRHISFSDVATGISHALVNNLSSKNHLELVKLIRSSKTKQCAVAIPRGWRDCLLSI